MYVSQKQAHPLYCRMCAGEQIESKTLIEQGENLREWIASARASLPPENSKSSPPPAIHGAAGRGDADGDGAITPSHGSNARSVVDSAKAFVSQKIEALWPKLRIHDASDDPGTVLVAAQ